MAAERAQSLENKDLINSRFVRAGIVLVGLSFGMHELGLKGAATVAKLGILSFLSGAAWNWATKKR